MGYAIQSVRAHTRVQVAVSTGRTGHSHRVLCRLLRTWGANITCHTARGNSQCNGSEAGSHLAPLGSSMKMMVTW